MNFQTTKLIQEFSSKFLDDIKLPYHTTQNTRIITESLPAILKSRFDLKENYKIYGSVGSGNWSEIPWLAILDKSVSTSTTHGYYIVILFDKYLREIYLSLAVGWTQFENEYGIKEGKFKMRAICNHYAGLLHTKPMGFNKGLIDLHANNNLGKGYEAGIIISKKYLVTDLSDEILFDDIYKLVDTYNELKTIVGDSILNLDLDSSSYDESLGEFKKKIASESFSQDMSESMKRLITIANSEPPEVRTRLQKEIVRNRKFADFVKKRASFICEVCKRTPFIQVNGKPYAEADHINPLGGKSKGLDSPDNMRCLCAQCHAVLTHGSEQEIKAILSKI